MTLISPTSISPSPSRKQLPTQIDLKPAPPHQTTVQLPMQSQLARLTDTKQKLAYNRCFKPLKKQSQNTLLLTPKNDKFLNRILLDIMKTGEVFTFQHKNLTPQHVRGIPTAKQSSFFNGLIYAALRLSDYSDNQHTDKYTPHEATGSFTAHNCEAQSLSIEALTRVITRLSPEEGLLYTTAPAYHPFTSPLAQTLIETALTQLTAIKHTKQLETTRHKNALDSQINAEYPAPKQTALHFFVHALYLLDAAGNLAGLSNSKDKLNALWANAGFHLPPLPEMPIFQECPSFVSSHPPAQKTDTPHETKAAAALNKNGLTDTLLPPLATAFLAGRHSNAPRAMGGLRSLVTAGATLVSGLMAATPVASKLTSQTDPPPAITNGLFPQEWATDTKSSKYPGLNPLIEIIQAETPPTNHHSFNILTQLNTDIKQELPHSLESFICDHTPESTQEWVPFLTSLIPNETSNKDKAFLLQLSIHLIFSKNTKTNKIGHLFSAQLYAKLSAEEEKKHPSERRPNLFSAHYALYSISSCDSAEELDERLTALQDKELEIISNISIKNLHGAIAVESLFKYINTNDKYISLLATTHLKLVNSLKQIQIKPVPKALKQLRDTLFKKIDQKIQDTPSIPTSFTAVNFNISTPKHAKKTFLSYLKFVPQNKDSAQQLTHLKQNLSATLNAIGTIKDIKHFLKRQANTEQSDAEKEICQQLLEEITKKEAAESKSRTDDHASVFSPNNIATTLLTLVSAVLGYLLKQKTKETQTQKANIPSTIDIEKTITDIISRDAHFNMQIDHILEADINNPDSQRAVIIIPIQCVHSHRLKNMSDKEAALRLIDGESKKPEQAGGWYKVGFVPLSYLKRSETEINIKTDTIKDCNNTEYKAGEYVLYECPKRSKTLAQVCQFRDRLVTESPSAKTGKSFDFTGMPVSEALEKFEKQIKRSGNIAYTLQRLFPKFLSWFISQMDEDDNVNVVLNTVKVRLNSILESLCEHTMSADFIWFILKLSEIGVEIDIPDSFETKALVCLASNSDINHDKTRQMLRQLFERFGNEIVGKASEANLKILFLKLSPNHPISLREAIFKAISKQIYFMSYDMVEVILKNKNLFEDISGGTDLVNRIHESMPEEGAHLQVMSEELQIAEGELTEFCAQNRVAVDQFKDKYPADIAAISAQLYSIESSASLNHLRNPVAVIRSLGLCIESIINILLPKSHRQSHKLDDKFKEIQKRFLSRKEKLARHEKIFTDWSFIHIGERMSSTERNGKTAKKKIEYYKKLFKDRTSAEPSAKSIQEVDSIIASQKEVISTLLGYIS